MLNQALGIDEVVDGKYRIESILGQGGMGAVYRAVHVGTKRTVALKVIHPRFSVDEEFVERFRREAEAVGRLRHPNVVDVTDFGFAAGGNGRRVAYLVMEYLDGRSLAEVLEEEEKLAPAWVVDILEQVCSAVEEAHRLGLVHRDLKPDNIWLEPNRLGGHTVKVLDFGLVKMSLPGPPTGEIATSSTAFIQNAGFDDRAPRTEAETLILPALAEASTRLKEPEDRRARPTMNDSAGLTRVGSVMGTPLYMSPEQCRGGGEQVDAKSDIYSLGVIAYHLLAGEPPFSGTPAQLIAAHQREEPPPLRKKNPRVPKKMSDLVMSALAKNPDRRPATAAGFAGALRASLEGSGFLLRSAISLYSGHFPTFLKISLIAYAPLVLTIAAFYFAEDILPANQLGVGLLFVAMVISNLLAYFVVSAATVPIVVQLILAPLRPVGPRTGFGALRSRWRTFAACSVIVTALILCGTAAFIIPGVILGMIYLLYSPVAVIEKLGVRQTLKRARQLVRRNWSGVFVITILQFSLPVLVWYAASDLTLNLQLHDDYNPKEFSFSFVVSGRSALFQLLNIFITPLTAVMTVLLYLKTRRAGGESLRETAGQLGAADINAKSRRRRQSADGNLL